jgi:hypothetical protein
MLFENLKKNDIFEEDMALYVCATVTTTTSLTTAPSPSSNWAQYSSPRLWFLIMKIQICLDAICFEKSMNQAVNESTTSAAAYKMYPARSAFS